MTGYYDLVLGLIPLAFAVIAAPLVAIGVTATTAIVAASVVAAGLIGHAMFVNGPVTDSTQATADTGFQAAD